MTIPIKALYAALATGAMAVSAAAPAMADPGFGGGFGHGDGWSAGNPRQAVEMCSRAAERQADRTSRGNARVSDVRDVRSTRSGFEVRGRIAVNSRDHGWNSRSRDFNHDTGSFTCRIEHGRVVSLDFSGIRGL